MGQTGGCLAGEDGQFRGARPDLGCLADIAQNILNKDAGIDDPSPDATVTRAELARVAQAVWTAYDAQKMPSSPFGTASASSPYYAKPCNERLASLPEALMQMTEDGYAWEYAYAADKPAYALTLMDYANIYSFIHTHTLDQAALREVAFGRGSDGAPQGVHGGRDRPASGQRPGSGHGAFCVSQHDRDRRKGLQRKMDVRSSPLGWRMEGITPDMVTAVQANYYNPLFTQEAADAFSQKLYAYTGVVTPVKWNQWKQATYEPDGSMEENASGRAESCWM